MSKNKNSSNNGAIFVIIIMVMTVLGFLFLASRGNSSDVAGVSAIQEGDSQIIEINAKAGYSPSNIQAKSGTETLLKIKTNNTFDCSLALVIPTLGVNEFLPSTGEKVYKITKEQATGRINGSCSMGMYRFTINFV